MMLPLLKRLLAGCILVALPTVMLIASWLSGSPHHEDHQEVNRPHAQEAKYESQNIPADERIARYTLWLALLTAGLVGASIFQGYFLIQSDRTARITADAARIAADAAVAAERARFFAEITHNFETVLLINASWQDELPLRRRFEMKLCFVNYGKTPGIVQDVGCGIEVSAGPPDPVYDVQLVQQEMIASGAKTEEVTYRMQRQATIGDARKIISRETRLWVYGYVDYNDVFGRRQTHRFFQVFIPSRGFQAWNHKTYNEST